MKTIVSHTGIGLNTESMKTAIRAPETRTRGFGPFLTWATEKHADGGVLLRTSRRHRKGLVPLIVAPGDIHSRVAVADIGHEWLHLWAPRRIGWWIAVLLEWLRTVRHRRC